MSNIELVYSHNKPKGIRNHKGFIILFPDVPKDQLKQQQKLAEQLAVFLHEK